MKITKDVGMVKVRQQSHCNQVLMEIVRIFEPEEVRSIALNPMIVDIK